MKLPAPAGKYQVGFAAFTAPVSNPRVIGGACLADGTPALKFEEISFNAFYPVMNEKRWHRGVDWLPRPLTPYLEGYAAFLHAPKSVFVPLAYGWASLLKMRVFGNAKLAPRPLVECDPSTGEAKWPLVIFSHGLGGTRTAYSEFCANLASEGYVVLALEHRDRSGPMAIVHSSGSDVEDKRPYLDKDGVHWAEGTARPEGAMPWRIEQLEFRRAEVYETFKVFSKAVAEGQPGSLQTMDLKDKTFDWAALKDKIEWEKDVIFAGHSFGSATAISMLSQAPTDGFSPLPISRAILLDPWVEPFPPSGPIAYPAGSTSRPATIVITSEAFAIWDNHFKRLQEIVKGWKSEGTTAYLLTILRSKHQEFSDFGVLAPGAKTAEQVIKGTHEATMKFLHGTLDADVKGKGRAMEFQSAKGNKRQIKGEPGELFVHL